MQKLRKINIHTMEREMASVIGQNTKENLSAFLKRLQQPVENTWDREVLALALRDLILEHPEYILYIHGKEILTFLIHLWESEETELSPEEWSMVGQLRLLGLVDYGCSRFPEEQIDTIYIVAEARERFYFYLKSKTARRLMDKYESWENILRGLMTYYGIISFKRLYFYFCKICREPVDDDILHLFLAVRISLLSFGGYALETGSKQEYYQNYEITEPETVLNHRMEDHGLDYYVPAYDTLHYVGNNNGLGEWDGISQLAEFLMKDLELPYYRTVVLIKSCVLMLQNGGNPKDTLQQFHSWCPECEKEETKVKKALEQLYDTVPVYALKGWSRKKLRKNTRSHTSFHVIPGGKITRKEDDTQ